MTKVKGSTLIPRLNYLKQHDPGGAWDQALGRLDPAFAAKIRAGVMTSEWYPLADFVALSRAIAETLGGGDLKVVWELGRFSAEEALRGVYKIFYKVGSPEFIIKSASRIWKQYYDQGSLTIESDAPVGKRLQKRAVLSGMDLVPEEFKHSVAGWVERTLELSGGKDVRVVIQRTPRPGVNLELICSWE